MIRRKLFENFAHPRGLWGRLAGQVIARKTANVECGKWALAKLDPRPASRPWRPAPCASTRRQSWRSAAGPDGRARRSCQPFSPSRTARASR
jgi:hypothetical protein